MRKPWERGVYSVGVYPTLPHRTNLRSDKNPASSTVRMRDSPMRGGVVIMGCYCFTTTGGYAVAAAEYHPTRQLSFTEAFSEPYEP